MAEKSRADGRTQNRRRRRKFARQVRSWADPRQGAATEVPAVSDSHRAVPLAALVAVPLAALFATPPPDQSSAGALSAQRLAAVIQGGRLTVAVNLPPAQAGVLSVAVLDDRGELLGEDRQS